MKQIQKPTTSRLTPFRKLAVAGCLVAAISCGGATQSVVPDYWGVKNAPVAGGMGRVTSLFSEKTVQIGGSEISFVIPKAPISELDRINPGILVDRDDFFAFINPDESVPRKTLAELGVGSERHIETERREDGYYARTSTIRGVPFFSNGRMEDHMFTFGFTIENGQVMAYVAFNKSLDRSPTKDAEAGTRLVKIDRFSETLDRMDGEKIAGARIVVDTIGIPTTVFAVPYDSKGRQMGVGPWGEYVLGMGFNTSSFKLVVRPVVIVPEGKSREDAREALMQKLGSP